uniref:Uncharacterized protein n=1 Tax=viral metagenome TaxID=1070528 RepID=A0A6M3K8S0_9ZZZZ
MRKWKRDALELCHDTQKAYGTAAGDSTRAQLVQQCNKTAALAYVLEQLIPLYEVQQRRNKNGFNEGAKSRQDGTE